MVASSFFCDIAKIEMFNPLFVQKACHHCQLYTGTLCLFRDSVRLRASMSHLRRIPFIRNDKNEGSCVEFLLRHCCPKSTANALRSAHTVSDKVLAASTLASSDIIITEVLKIGSRLSSVTYTAARMRLWRYGLEIVCITGHTSLKQHSLL